MNRKQNKYRAEKQFRGDQPMLIVGVKRHQNDATGKRQTARHVQWNQNFPLKGIDAGGFEFHHAMNTDNQKDSRKGQQRVHHLTTIAGVDA